MPLNTGLKEILAGSSGTNRGEKMKYSKMVECLNKLVAEKSLKLDGVNVSTVMQGAIELWDLMYSNRAPWLSKSQKSAGIPASIASEISRLVTLELKSEVTGDSERAKYINNIYKNVLSSLRKQVEYGCAKGSMVFKPYPSNDGIAVQYNAADSFYPITFDSNGNITQCAFTEQYTRGKDIYTRVELHSLADAGVNVYNFAYLSKTGATLGGEVSLKSVKQWEDIEPHGILQGAKKLTIGFFKVPLANNIDTDSPLGVSVFSRATEHIMIADKRYNQIDWEYDSKETAVHLASSLLKYDKTNDKYEYPGGRERLYRTLEYNTGAADKPFIDTYSPDIRDESYYHGYNQQLRRIEFDSGLAYGTLSDVQEVEKTAEEIKSSKQRSYATVSDIQQALQRALIDLIEAIDFWVSAENLSSDGDYEVSFDWDDSVVTDNEKEREDDRKDLAAGIMRPEEYRSKWYGETLEEALENLPEVAKIDV
jgi:A118 family predicted phage portal protein